MEEKRTDKNQEVLDHQDVLDQDVMEEELRVVTLTFDDGTKLDCGILAEYPVEGKDYIALFPLESIDSEEDDTDLFLFRKVMDKDDVSFEDIEDDDEFNAVMDALHDLMEDADDDMEVITLTFDDGSQMDCEVFCTFSVNDKQYVALLPMDEDDNAEFLFYGIVETDDGNVVSLVDILDDDEYDEVTDVFESEFIDGQSEDDDFENNSILTFEDGTEQACKIIGIFPAEGRTYIALFPADEDGNVAEDATIGIYRFEAENGYSAKIGFIDDDDEFAIAADTFSKLVQETIDAD